MGDRAKAGELLGNEIVHLREELDVMAAKGMLPPALKGLRQELDALEPTALDGRTQAPSAGDRKA
jgi:hypothetical protein